MRLFAPRYKHYAAWPVVILCRILGHRNRTYWVSGDVNRCADCGDDVDPKAKQL
jgi:hypothetical protein